MKRLWKRVMASGPARSAIGWILALCIRFIHVTSRWQIVGQHHLDALDARGQRFVACFWHGRIMMMAFLWRQPEAFRMLISGHRDGQLIASTVRNLNIETVWGSSSRDGASALRALLKELKAGRSVGLTPDGPRGPRMRAKAGTISAARIARVPVLPIAYGVARRKVLRSWDSFIVPGPFNRGVFMIGEPIDVSEGTLEEARLRVENILIALTQEADRLAGATPIEPAAPLRPEDEDADAPA